MPVFEQHAPIYRAFGSFLTNCLGPGGHSLLWPEKAVWTPENIAEMKTRLVDNPMLGTDLSFSQKLQEQMRDAPQDLWLLLGDLYFIYYLPSMSIKPASKRAGIQWVLEQSQAPVITASPLIWDALETGFVRTGQRYHLKYLQQWLILLFAHQLKQQPDPQAVLQDR
ncbi:MAG: hypothetical protein K8I30_02255, partial [Anaerolineae bacterium]|nr:hypothetical protein [Anaerolineae bacterium]